MSKSFFRGKGAPRMQTPNLNLEARAMGAPAYTARAAGGAQQKDLAAALAINNGRKLGPLAKTSASNAPGPKKV
jgi:hypothetical protein